MARFAPHDVPGLSLAHHRILIRLDDVLCWPRQLPAGKFPLSTPNPSQLTEGLGSRPRCRSGRLVVISDRRRILESSTSAIILSAMTLPTSAVDEPTPPRRCWSTILDEDEHLWICMLERDHWSKSDHVSAAYVCLTDFPPVLAVQSADRPKTWGTLGRGR